MSGMLVLSYFPFLSLSHGDYCKMLFWEGVRLVEFFEGGIVCLGFVASCVADWPIGEKIGRRRVGSIGPSKGNWVDLRRHGCTF